jgi:hypothetical protein
MSLVAYERDVRRPERMVSTQPSLSDLPAPGLAAPPTLMVPGRSTPVDRGDAAVALAAARRGG